jgi:anti-sigma B factor antagonist
MNSNNLSAPVRHLNNTVGIVDLQGTVTGGSETVMMDAYAQASRSKAPTVVLNFSGLEHVSSTGIGLVMILISRARHLKHKLLAYGLSEQHHRIFTLTGLDNALGIYTSEDDALTSLGIKGA